MTKWNEAIQKLNSQKDALDALSRLANKCWNSQSYCGDSSIGEDVKIINDFILNCSHDKKEGK